MLDDGLQGISVSGEGLIILEPGKYALTLNESLCADTSTVCPSPSSIDPITKIGLKEYWNTNGEIEITRLDISTGIISGLFNFDAYSQECQDTVKITKGRFDIKYK